MKNLFFGLFMAASVLSASAQFNIPSDFEGDYCHHAKSASEQLKYYHSPVSSSSLLGDYDVKFYFLDIAVENNTVDIAGSVTTRAVPATQPLDTFAFELSSALTVDAVYLNGVPTAFQHANDLGTVPIQEPIPAGNLFEVKIVYHGTPPTGSFFSGVTTDYNANYDKYVTWSLSEPYAAKDWWPTKQDLRDKIDSVWVFLTTSPENKAGSQGLLTGVTTMPNGKLRYEWKSNYPIDFYLISFAVADYMEYNLYAYPAGTGDSVFIQNYIYDDPACLTNNQEDIDRTADFIELFSDLFGLYPFIDEKYGHCLTELGGGMEHQTMTTIGGFGFGLVAHELGHMWFGDKVTCATWSDIWINEGFATYTDYLAHSYLSTPYYDSLWLKIRHDQVKAQPGGSVYVPEDELENVWRIFDGRLSYSKGSLLLHMIRFELQDDDLFFNVLQTYMEEFGDSTATGEDFREWLEYISGKDFTDFFDQWYYGEGYPIYDIVWHQDAENLFITSTQSTSTQVTPLFKMTVPYYLQFTDGTDSTLLLFQDANVNNYTLPMNKEIDSFQVDPEQWILHKLNSVSVGIEETENPVHFTLGPNPAQDFVYLNLSHEMPTGADLSVTDLAGKVVMKGQIHETSNRIGTGHLTRGIYLLNLSKDGYHLTKKLILN